MKSRLHAILWEDDPKNSKLEDSEDNAETGYNTAPSSPDFTEQAIVETQDQVMLVSAHAISGIMGPTTFSLVTYVNGKRGVALVDSGSTHSFMDYESAIQNKCKLTYVKLKKVTVAGGWELQTDAIVDNMTYVIQGSFFKDSFKLMKLGVYDLILGADWIYTYSSICLDLQQRYLTTTKEGTTVMFLDHTNPGSLFLINAAKLEHMLSKKAVWCIIQTHLLQEKEPEEEAEIPSDIEALLSKYSDIFQEPAGLLQRNHEIMPYS